VNIPSPLVSIVENLLGVSMMEGILPGDVFNRNLDKL
jgi:hypothetical protein